ncbi:hypothetical protein PC116_g13037 [Phytophthora cactorum]|uniref:Uncharacterized protein n=1 Tax=Phytophthora cactorum TaxID=29920 RepID=A0A8T1KU11_9STRA|nr:hypothetical protein Pcac1_g16530 [Phytophthora cactorum]KAG2908472.1 hypothetical protein PC114_g10443 [Phytophthora cactorum]KAG2953489.1 hypothetical protein PC117_g1937 [Phytophthora cactorum]KAG3020850.1 hypothetical protein PC119_g9823 [Phytophthora cactorum]KAG3169391.1 hypothetical protein C6341_g11059 [Phytophthora cactorum]
MSDEPPPPQRWWEQLVDPLCARGSPWHSSRVIPVRSADFIGDSLVSKLQQAARKVVNDKPIAGWSRTLLERIGDYENESRVLVKLADTGRVIQLLENGIKTSLHIATVPTSLHFPTVGLLEKDSAKP